VACLYWTMYVLDPTVSQNVLFAGWVLAIVPLSVDVADAVWAVLVVAPAGAATRAPSPSDPTSSTTGSVDLAILAHDAVLLDWLGAPSDSRRHIEALNRLRDEGIECS